MALGVMCLLLLEPMLVECSTRRAAIGEKEAAILAGVRNDQKTINHTKAPEKMAQAMLGTKYSFRGSAQLRRNPKSRPPKINFRDNYFLSL